MGRHPLDDCEPAKRLAEIVAAETQKLARKVSQEDVTDEVFESALDDILHNSQLNLDLSIIDCDYDKETSTLHIIAAMRAHFPVENIELHIIL